MCYAPQLGLGHNLSLVGLLACVFACDMHCNSSVPKVESFYELPVCCRITIALYVPMSAIACKFACGSLYIIMSKVA